ncbi:MAG: hypothetical protein HOP12_11595 [Candidatus Eisenbacteria bacterium]|uniref:Photosynthetic complex assembly protein n=1 Tax=Eiseniibacteriota bacterium TaxID=2212470 RepID=A0A849T0E3_UNCEI|nr:hypothetical protein [Candidatus Eisenbacteria bacterium]
MTSPPPARDPGEAIAALERQVERLGALAAFLAIAVVLLFAQRVLPTPVLVAEQFLVRNPNGVVRAELSSHGGREPVLRLNDAAGKERILLGVRPDGTTEIRLADSLNRHRAALALWSDGSPNLVMMADDGRSRIRMSVGSNAVGSLLLADSLGRDLRVAP